MKRNGILKLLDQWNLRKVETNFEYHANFFDNNCMLNPKTLFLRITTLHLFFYTLTMGLLGFKNIHAHM